MKLTKQQFQEIYQLMKLSFPVTELRTYEDQYALLENPHYHLQLKRNEAGELLGVLAGWNFADFRFVEHFAVSPASRSRGIGKQMLQAYIGAASTPVVLEVELPNTPDAIRRIAFYQRLGFHHNAFSYYQPPLRAGQAPLALNIMSYPGRVSEREFQPYKDVLYKEVYKVDSDSALIR